MFSKIFTAIDFVGTTVISFLKKQKALYRVTGERLCSAAGIVAFD
jgi:hypothetical protein